MSSRMGLTDEELVGRAREGSDEAFTELVERYTSLVYRVAIGITASAPEAEEVVQETFLRVFRSLDQYQPTRASFKTWVLAIARNQSINVYSYLKRRATRAFSEVFGHETDSMEENVAAAENSHDAEYLMANKQEMARVQAALNELPERQRTALMLKTQEELSYAEIGVIMGASASSVESLIFRARKRLLEIMESE
ncbi:MAG: sigma-70 family RNA polymerase sigma factor [Deltaproteobacteria bacterium]|nr:sigma-70 family RNA polymerase sigma factor [Deltaproteobacteria bacterium]